MISNISYLSKSIIHVSMYNMAQYAISQDKNSTYVKDII